MIADDRDDAGHWDALADRIASAAVRRAQPSLFEWLTESRAGWVTTALFAAAALAFMMLPGGESGGAAAPSWSDGLTPTDAIGKTMTRDQPPPIGALLLEPAAEGQR